MYEECTRMYKTIGGEEMRREDGRDECMRMYEL